MQPPRTTPRSRRLVAPKSDEGGSLTPAGNARTLPPLRLDLPQRCARTAGRGENSATESFARGTPEPERGCVRAWGHQPQQRRRATRAAAGRGQRRRAPKRPVHGQGRGEVSKSAPKTLPRNLRMAATRIRKIKLKITQSGLRKRRPLFSDLRKLTPPSPAPASACRCRKYQSPSRRSRVSPGAACPARGA